MTRRFTGSAGKVTGLEALEVDWSGPDEHGRMQMTERPGSEFQLDVDLVILALGFTGVQPSRFLEDLGLQLNERGVLEIDSGYQTSTPRVFCAGDMESGPAHVVRAMAAGQEAAESIHRMLSGE
jgi:glutamate synthase (NADPH/NADH) small chain